MFFLYFYIENERISELLCFTGFIWFYYLNFAGFLCVNNGLMELLFIYPNNWINKKKNKNIKNFVSNFSKFLIVFCLYSYNCILYFMSIKHAKKIWKNNEQLKRPLVICGMRKLWFNPGIKPCRSPMSVVTKAIVNNFYKIKPKHWI